MRNCFFIIRQADAFVTYQYFQNEQNEAKKRYKSPLRTFKSQNCVLGRFPTPTTRFRGEIIRQADAFVRHQYFQNEQNGAKKRYKSQNSILRSWNTPVSSWIDEGRSKRLPVNSGRSVSRITVLAEQIVHGFLEIYALRVPGPVSFSSDRISIPKIDKRHTVPLRSPPALPGRI